MNITAEQLREKSFEKNFRGYDKDEVDAFLKKLAEEWGKILQEKTDLEKKLDLSEKEAKKLKDVEESLFRT
jgi:cell division initiation protein